VSEPGRVVVVGTPIGNLGDLSPRASETLAEADLICCEDTRRTRALLSAAGIRAPRLVAVHEHNEAAGAALAVSAAAAGRLVAVVSDAGMPGLSDPGRRVVAAALAAGVVVSVVPGPDAAVAAVVLSGLDTARWCFEGFLPRKGRLRAGRLAALAAETRPSVLYEAPHRVERTLSDLCDACGSERTVVVARELTKRHEQRWQGRLGEALEWVRANPPRGEWVLVLDGAPPAGPPSDADICGALDDAARSGSARRDAIAQVASSLGVSRRRVYELATSRRDGR
jgi:16S rRNA (cytidine1402-2'-O)-methyltransferase